MRNQKYIARTNLVLDFVIPGPQQQHTYGRFS